MVDDLAKQLNSGKPLILPTETVYGLFAQALDETAVNRVYEIKGRPRDKAMNLNVASLEDIFRFSIDQPPYLETLYQAFLPGPLTVILKANNQVPTWINSGLKTVGFRVPNHPVTLELIRRTGPLIGPSANLSGQESGISFSEIKNQLGQDLPGYADDTAISGLDSTILDLSGERGKILRQGTIGVTDILAVVPHLSFDC